jgi:hypothetical protein
MSCGTSSSEAEFKLVEHFGKRLAHAEPLNNYDFRSSSSAMASADFVPCACSDTPRSLP